MTDVKSLSNLLPPPELAKQFEEIQPGFLKWQMDIIEREAIHAQECDLAAHRFDLQRLDLEANIVKRGQIFGLCIGLFALAAGSLTAVYGAPLSGGLIGSGGVIGLVAVFVFGRKAPSENPSSETKQITA